MRDGTKTEDQPALLEQWHRQLGAARAAAHLARRSRSVERRLALLRPPAPARGRAASGRSCSARAPHLGGGVAIVDWRHAPISRLFYRYRQGDEYDEEIAGRERSGEVAAAPHGHDPRPPPAARRRARGHLPAPTPTRPDGWHRIAPEPPRLAGGEGAALRAHAVGDGDDAPARRRPPRRRRPRRQAPARHRRADRPRAVRADHPADRAASS